MPCIEHTATVVAVNKDAITVELLSRSACSACHLKENCSMSENKVRRLCIPDVGNYQIGQTVNVEISASSGWIAVFWGYIMPLILVLIALLSAISLTDDETTAALSSLAVLPPYYFILWLFRHKLAKKISFRIKS